MKPIEFEGMNITFAKDQPEYEPLPAHRTPDGQVVFCWKLTLRERLRLLVTGKLWQSVLTFNGPLQPQYMSAKTLMEKPASPATN